MIWLYKCCKKLKTIIDLLWLNLWRKETRHLDITFLYFKKKVPLSFYWPPSMWKYIFRSDEALKYETLRGYLTFEKQLVKKHNTFKDYNSGSFNFWVLMSKQPKHWTPVFESHQLRCYTFKWGLLLKVVEIPSLNWLTDLSGESDNWN